MEVDDGESIEIRPRTELKGTGGEEGRWWSCDWRWMNPKKRRTFKLSDFALIGERIEKRDWRFWGFVNGQDLGNEACNQRQ